MHGGMENEENGVENSDIAIFLTLILHFRFMVKKEIERIPTLSSQFIMFLKI